VSYRGFTNAGYTQANDDLNKTAWEKGTLDDTVTATTRSSTSTTTSRG
jgi:iron complex outermembrane receptor protein